MHTVRGTQIHVIFLCIFNCGELSDRWKKNRFENTQNCSKCKTIQFELQEWSGWDRSYKRMECAQPNLCMFVCDTGANHKNISARLNSRAGKRSEQTDPSANIKNIFGLRKRLNEVKDSGAHACICLHLYESMRLLHCIAYREIARRDFSMYSIHTLHTDRFHTRTMIHIIISQHIQLEH